MKKLIFTLVVLIIVVKAQTQNAGIGTTMPVAKLEIMGLYQNPTVPGFTSAGMLRLSAQQGDGIDIGKMSDVPFTGWIQAGFNGIPDPMSLQPVGGNVGIGTTNPANKLSVQGNADFSGKVSVGIIGPEISAALAVNSTTQGFLPPRMTSADRNTISTPVAGLVIWCSNCGISGELQVHNGSTWTNMIGGPKAPAIGDVYGGGKVAYILQPGDPGYIPGEIHGIIGPEFDQSTGSTWGCPETFIQGGDGTALGTGNQNTIDIVSNCTEVGTAAKKCSDLVLNGYSDWYLPSKDELNKLWINREAIGGFSNGTYWSSSEFSSYDAWDQMFIAGSFQCNAYKATSNHVRAVRSF